MPNADDRVNLFAENVSPSLLLRILKKHWRVLLAATLMIGSAICFSPATVMRSLGGIIEWFHSGTPELKIVGAVLAATHGIELLLITPLTWLIKKYLKWVEKRRPKPLVPGMTDSLSDDDSDKIFPAWKKATYWFAQSAWIYGYYAIYLAIRAQGLPPGGSESPLFSALTSSWIGQAWVYPVVITIPIFYIERFLTLSPRYEERRKLAAQAYNKTYKWRLCPVLVGVIIITELAALMA